MSAEREERLVQAWREAVHRDVPPFDRVRGRNRLLEAERVVRSRRAVKRWALGGAAALAVAASVLFFIELRMPAATTFTVAGQRGEVGEWLATRDAEPLTLDFSEGTQVAFGSRSRARVEEIDSHGARVFVERGSLRAKVVHRSGASWRFGAGPFEVEVTGTELDVDWSPDQGEFAVTVTRGAVVVRGPYIHLPQEVRAGERCRVSLTTRSMLIEQLGGGDAAQAPASLPPTAEPATSDVGATDGERTSVPALSPPSPRGEPANNPLPAWLALARDDKAAEAIVQAERVGLARLYRNAKPEELFDLARAARLAGRPEIERNALLSCRRRFTGEAAAARAAFLLGRAAAPREAASWFETYLREQPSGVLAREAAGRIIESYQHAGDGAAARQAARNYLAKYPDGPHAPLARQVLASERGEGD